MGVTLSTLLALVLSAGNPALHFRAASFDPRLGSPALDAPLAELAPGPDARRIVWLEDAPDRAAREKLERLGVRLLRYVPEGAFLATVPPEAAEALARDPGVRFVGPLPPGLKLAPELMHGNQRRIQLQLFADADVGAVYGRIADIVAPGRVKLSSSDPTGAIVEVEGAAPLAFATLASLARLDDVESVEPGFDPRPANNDSIWVGQSYDTVNRRNYDLSATIWNHGILGTGQVVAVVDTGLDSDACQFKLDGGGVTDAEELMPPTVGTLWPDRKVIAYYVRPGSDPYGNAVHGTAVAACAVGDDFATLSTPASAGHDDQDGMAPNARLVMQAPSTIAVNMVAVLEQAHGSGARIHNDSWIGGPPYYSAETRLTDEATWRYEDMLVVFPAANEGPDPNTIPSPNMAKNVLTVGATSAGSDNDAEDMAGFSSRGPTFDGRTKPDVVAPGLGLRSADSDDDHSSNNCDVTGNIAGTSFSSPLTAGFAALARQYYTDGFYPSGSARPGDAHTPSAALLKATLINGARPISGSDPIPSFNQGWGRILLDDALYFAGDEHRLRVVDRPNRAGLETGQVDVLHVLAGSAGPLEVTLAWTDPASTTIAASTLVNDLDLEVRAPDATTYLGNVFSGGVSVEGGGHDELNNVEGVLIATPAPGLYEIRVVAANVPGNAEPLSIRQGYGLVATGGDCSSTLATPGAPVLTDSAAGVRVRFSRPAGAVETTVLRSEGGCAAPPASFYAVGVTSGDEFLDTTVMPDETYGYRLRSSDGCGESPLGPCAEVAPLGLCVLPPEFDGVGSAAVDETTCAATLFWSDTPTLCPLIPGVRYNVYRSVVADFVPASGNLVATVTGTSTVDTTLGPGRTYYYIVRAEDYSAGRGGPNGGNEDPNFDVLPVTPGRATTNPGTLLDDGGDSRSWFRLSYGWSYSAFQNASAGGRLSYRSAPRDDWHYGGSVCSALTSMPIELDATSSLELTYSARYNLEEQWDGVVVEISDNGGVDWVDLPPDAGYPSDFGLTEIDGVPINACGFPKERPAFSGPPGNAGLTDWTVYTSDLSAWAGSTVRIRYRLSTDTGQEYDAFYLDDIRVTGALVTEACEPCTVPSAVGNTLHGVKSAEDVSITWTDIAGAVSYQVGVSADRDFASLQKTLPAPDGATGATDPGALSRAPSLLLYRGRGLGNCDEPGPF